MEIPNCYGTSTDFLLNSSTNRFIIKNKPHLHGWGTNIERYGNSDISNKGRHNEIYIEGYPNFDIMD